MEYTGLDSAPKILTEEDVLRHCYGVEASPEVLEEAGSVLADDATADPVPVAESAPLADQGGDDSPGPDVEAPAAEAPAAEAPALSVVESLLAENTKAQLVEKATEMGLDASGSKTALAERIAEKLAQG